MRGVFGRAECLFDRCECFAVVVVAADVGEPGEQAFERVGVIDPARAFDAVPDAVVQTGPLLLTESAAPCRSPTIKC